VLIIYLEPTDMLITITNNTINDISTDIGVVGKNGTLSADLSPDTIYKLKGGLDV
jgi:hypothetical protein